VKDLLLPALFLGLPFLCYLGQGFLVYLPHGRLGMTLMMTGYAVALIGQYLDNKGI
jgi:hypothetical protein